MVEDESESRETLQNKGVNVTSDSLPTVNPPETPTPANVKELRNQVHNIINQMGPGTPHFTQNSSSEADNEESIYETTSVFSSVYKAKTEVRTKPVVIEKSDTSTREISECSALPMDEIPYEKEKKRDCGCRHCPKRTSTPPPPPPPPPAPCYCPCRPNYNRFGSPERYHISRKEQSGRCFLSRLLCKKPKAMEIPLDLYKMDVMQPEDDHSPPRKLIFNLVEGVRKPDTNSVGINTKLLTAEKLTQDTIRTDVHRIQTDVPDKKVSVSIAADDVSPYRYEFSGPRESVGLPAPASTQHFSQLSVRKQTVTRTTVPIDNNQAGRVDVYYFDHGNSGYYETTDCVPYIMTEMIADRTERYTTKFWAELFGTVHIGFSFCTSFILQFFRFLLYSIVRPLTVGLTQLASDYFFKPCLAVLFNAVIQPPLIFLYNVASSLRDLCYPIAEGIGYFLREIAEVLRAIRLVEIRKGGKCCTVERKRHLAPCQATTCEIGSEVPKYSGPYTCSG